MKGFQLIAAVIAIGAVFTVVGAEAQNSDPGGAWSKCQHYTGKTIIVEGDRCPNGWRKIY